MRNAVFVWLWLLIFAGLSFEYYQLKREKPELISLLKSKQLLNKDFNTSTDSGRPIGFALGVAGMAVMLLTNLYIFRKRFQFMQKWGSLKNWLNFHIFCGLVGPTFILFHSDFKVRGLVAISFWSMWVSFASGIVGRYFYTQLASMESDFIERADSFIRGLKRVAEKNKAALPEDELKGYMNLALVTAGATQTLSNPVTALFSSMAGDIRLMMSPPKSPAGTGELGSYALKGFAVNTRRAKNLENFKKLMGYWHTFHMPFAVFMYLAAVFHIAAALILGVTH
jgi:hypothetical protein